MSMNGKVLRNNTVKVHVESTDFRTETLMGVEYKVVPVVALIEGVLQGANAAQPEYAPAAEFGKFPESWNYRPLVHGHPQIDGIFVSANHPSVLADWSFGFIFNARLDDDKLKVEAWIDPLRIEALGEDAQNTFARLEKGETVEVSVGCWTDVLPLTGIHAQSQKKYSGVWANVVPDHLAFLPEGQIGACSVEAGCGVPRLNSSAAITTSSCGGECKCGGVCMTDAVNANTGAGTGDPVVLGAPAILAEAQAQKDALSVFERLRTNAIDPNITFNDASSIIQTALRAHPKVDWGWIVALTTEKVVYETYVEGIGYNYQAMAYTLDANGAVTFSGEPEPVNLITSIVPRVNAESGEETGSEVVNVNSEVEDTTMAEGTGQPAGSEAAPAAGTAATTEAPLTPAAAPAVQAAAPRTLQQYLEEAPAELREVLSEGLALQKQRKDALIKGLMDSGRCRFAQADLENRGINELEGLAALANVTTYEGRAIVGSQEGINANSSREDNTIPEAPRALTSGQYEPAGGVLARRTATA